jgi:hypothetical protein
MEQAEEDRNEHVHHVALPGAEQRNDQEIGAISSIRTMVINANHGIMMR